MIALAFPLPESRTAWLCLRTLRGEPAEIRAYSEQYPTTTRPGENYHPVARATARDYGRAEEVLGRWWSSRKSWQKRALLLNALTGRWEPLEIALVRKRARARA